MRRLPPQCTSIPPHIPPIWTLPLPPAGYSQAAVLGRSHALLQGPDTDPVVLADIAAAMDEGRPVVAEILVYRSDGSSFWCQVGASCPGQGQALLPQRRTHLQGFSSVWVAHEVFGMKCLKRSRSIFSPVPPLRPASLPQISITPIRDAATGGVANFVAVQRDISQRKAVEAASNVREQALRCGAASSRVACPCSASTATTRADPACVAACMLARMPPVSRSPGCLLDGVPGVHRQLVCACLHASCCSVCSPVHPHGLVSRAPPAHHHACSNLNEGICICDATLKDCPVVYVNNAFLR